MPCGSWWTSRRRTRRRRSRRCQRRQQTGAGNEETTGSARNVVCHSRGRCLCRCRHCRRGPAAHGAADDRRVRPTAAVDVPRVRRCVGDPPRQTEDPQSPPCVAAWSGDNGGATWQGVTRDEIVVAVPCADPCYWAYELFVAHVNKRFELYGRRIRAA